MLTAYHSLLVVDARGSISGSAPDGNGKTGREAQVIQDLAHVAETISVKNYREFYHDALELRDQLYNLFNLGLLSLEDRARGEDLFWAVARRAVRFSKSAKFVADEFVELEGRLHEKYVCNFSVFQSIPDHWALDQLFPVIPIHRLNEPPVRRATLVDITCDSDGEVEKFVDLKDIKEALEVHDLRPGEPYWLGFMLIGAYQDTMGDLHNLFGRVHEADVILDPRGGSIIREVRPGEAARDTLAQFGYTEEMALGSLTNALRERVNKDVMTREEADTLIADYRRRLDHYTYLE
jgi:arginine decarboxylase